MTRAALEEMLAACDRNMKAHDRAFVARLEPSARPENIGRAERELGCPLPPSYRAFLLHTDGVDAFSLGAPGELSTMLEVLDSREIANNSKRLNETLCNMYQDNDVKQPPPFYINCGLCGEDQVMLRSCDEAGVESPAYYYDAWAMDWRWEKAADSFEEWLLQSLRRMAETSRGFRGLLDLW